MANENRCPSCGLENTAEATLCSGCNFPLHDGAPVPVAAPPVAAPVGGEPPASAPAASPEIDMRKIRPIRPRRPASADQQLQMQLIVGLGGAAVVIAILYVAWQGFQKNNVPAPAVAGASPTQLADITLATNQIKADSTNINAQIALANTLYDTANWSEAIIHYRSALRLDPTRVTTVVDLGVCYYNLSDVSSAETLFKRALELDPRQPIALFNLGIVSESHNELKQALDYFHRAMAAGPPEGMGEALTASVQRVTDKLKKPPGMPGPGGGMPPGGSSPGGGF